jgi:multiple sugar transport system permease protein
MRRSVKAGRLVMIVLILAWTIGPIYVALSASFSTQADTQSVPAHWWPHKVTLGAYRSLLGSGNGGGIGQIASEFGHSLLESTLISVETTVLVLVLTVGAGFAFARLRFPVKRPLFFLVVGTVVLPVFVLVVPLFKLLTAWHLMNTNPGLVIIYTTSGIPLAIWIFQGYVRDLPIEPYEAAQVDGCGKLGAFFRIVLPQARSGIAALVAIVFLTAWGQFLIPLLFTQGSGNEPVTVLITQLVGRHDVSLPLIAAAGLIAMLPPTVVALVTNKHIRGMLVGSNQ